MTIDDISKLLDQKLQPLEKRMATRHDLKAMKDKLSKVEKTMATKDDLASLEQKMVSKLELTYIENVFKQEISANRVGIKAIQDTTKENREVLIKVRDYVVKIKRDQEFLYKLLFKDVDLVELSDRVDRIEKHLNLPSLN